MAQSLMHFRPYVRARLVDRRHLERRMSSRNGRVGPLKHGRLLFLFASIVQIFVSFRKFRTAVRILKSIALHGDSFGMQVRSFKNLV